MFLLLKDLPEIVAKVQREVDPLRSQEDNSGVTKDVALKELTSVSMNMYIIMSLWNPLVIVMY